MDELRWGWELGALEEESAGMEGWWDGLLSEKKGGSWEPLSLRRRSLSHLLSHGKRRGGGCEPMKV